MGGEIDNDLIVSLGGDSTDYDLMAATVLKDTTDLAENVKNETTEMVKHIVQKSKDGMLEIKKVKESIKEEDTEDESGGAKSGGNLAANLHHIHAGLLDVVSMTNRAKLALEEFSGPAAELAKTAQTVASLGARTAHLASTAIYAQQTMGTLSTTVAGPIAAGVAVFAASVYATTYAIRGQEAANNSLNDSMELGKILLAAGSFGHLDYTESTKMAKEGEEALAKQVQSSDVVMGDMILKRTNLLRNLKDTVEDLGVVSQKTEEKFIASLKHDLSKSGATGGQINTAEADARRQFEQNAIDAQIIKLREKLDTMGRTSEEIGREALLTKNVSAAELERYDAMVHLLHTKEEMAELDKVAADDAKELIEHGREMTREKEKTMTEGKRLADSLRTDEEKRADELAHVNELFDKGAIGAETLQRAIEKINETKDPKTKAQNIRIGNSGGGIDAVAFGSSADYSVREQIKQQEKMLDALTMIADNTAGSTKVTINPIRLRGA